MELSGSCHCKAITFTLESHTPYPFMICYCSICRKTQGGNGGAVNIMGEKGTLKVNGGESLSVYRARIEMPDGRVEQSPGQRHFCSGCGSALWMWDPRWPELVHPFASAIDTPLPIPPERVHIMLSYAPAWVIVPEGPGHVHFKEYPEESIEGWHKTRGLWQD